MILSFLLFIFGSAQGVQAVLFAFVVVFNVNIIFIFCYFGNQLTDEVCQESFCNSDINYRTFAGIFVE